LTNNSNFDRILLVVDNVRLPVSPTSSLSLIGGKRLASWSSAQSD